MSKEVEILRSINIALEREFKIVSDLLKEVEKSGELPYTRDNLRSLLQAIYDSWVDAANWCHELMREEALGDYKG